MGFMDLFRKKKPKQEPQKPRLVTAPARKATAEKKRDDDCWVTDPLHPASPMFIGGSIPSPDPDPTPSRSTWGTWTSSLPVSQASSCSVDDSPVRSSRSSDGYCSSASSSDYGSSSSGGGDSGWSD